MRSPWWKNGTFLSTINTDCFIHKVDVIGQSVIVSAQYNSTLTCSIQQYLACLIHSLCYLLDLPLIHNFRPTWPGLIIKLIATLVKFIELSGYCTVMNCAFTFHTTCFWLLLRCCSPVRTCKSWVLTLDYITYLSVLLSNHMSSEAMHYVSVH